MDLTPFYVAAGREAQVRGARTDVATAALLQERLSLATDPAERRWIEAWLAGYTAAPVLPH